MLENASVFLALEKNSAGAEHHSKQFDELEKEESQEDASFERRPATLPMRRDALAHNRVAVQSATKPLQNTEQ